MDDELSLGQAGGMMLFNVLSAGMWVLTIRTTAPPAEQRWTEIERRMKMADMMEWISVNERLPEDEKPVLAFIGYEESMTGFMHTESYLCSETNPHWKWDGLLKDYGQRTLFWMPLPEPPNGWGNV